MVKARTGQAKPNEKMQTFVFSATMSKDLQRNLKRRQRPKREGKKEVKPASTLGKPCYAVIIANSKDQQTTFS